MLPHPIKEDCSGSSGLRCHAHLGPANLRPLRSHMEIPGTHGGTWRPWQTLLIDLGVSEYPIYVPRPPPPINVIDGGTVNTVLKDWDLVRGRRRMPVRPCWDVSCWGKECIPRGEAMFAKETVKETIGDGVCPKTSVAAIRVLSDLFPWQVPAHSLVVLKAPTNSLS